MQIIGRKVYMYWGKNVVAVEILAEEATAFSARTGITLNEKESAVVEVRDVFGQTVERFVGKPTNEPSYTATKGISDFLQMFKMITYEDIECACKNSGISTELVDNSVAKINGWGADFKDPDFIGFIEVPSKNHNKIIHDSNVLSLVSFYGADSRQFVPVFLSEKTYEFFDNEDKDEIAVRPWALLFLGTDNSSFGERFATREDAMYYLKEGYKNGFKMLKGYNS